MTCGVARSPSSSSTSALPVALVELLEQHDGGGGGVDEALRRGAVLEPAR